MRYKNFEYFGVELFIDNKLVSVRTCETLAEAIEYARDKGACGYTYKFITLDKYGCKIQKL